MTARLWGFLAFIRLIDKGLSGAIRGQLLICVINGILTWIGLVLVGVKYPLILAILAGVMSLIPIFGSILSSVPIVLVALVSSPSGIDLLKGLMTLGWIIGIHLLEANLLNPKIIGSAARIHPLVVIFAVVAGEKSYGPIGALLAVPLVSAVQAVFIYLRQKVRGETGDVRDAHVG
jgi:predicted PurR-regulated permease PerM